MLTAALVLSAACAGETLPGDPERTSPAAPAPSTRSADPAARGLSDADFPRTRELAPGIYAYEQLRSAGEERFTTNSLIVVSDAGVLVADGQGSHEETARLVATVADITDAPIRHVVIASDHGDHTAGNTAFPPDAEFWAHPASAAELVAAAERALAAGRPPIPLATRLVETEERLDLGGREVRLLHLGRAHTGGDLVVWLPAERVLFLSEAFLHRIFPAMRSAYPSEWVAMLEAAQALDAAIYVPGHGFVDEPAVLREELETFRRALRTVIDEARRLHGAGVDVEEAVATARFGPLESWSLRSSQAERAIRRVYTEIEGELPPRR